MYGSTKQLLDYVMKGQHEPTFPRPEPAAHVNESDPKVLELRLKRKYQMGLIKKMMQDAGYDDLAKMTTIGKRSYDIEE